MTSAPGVGREERVGLERGGALEAVARGLAREVQQQRRHAGVGEVRGNLRAHGAGAEDGRGQSGWSLAPPRARAQALGTTARPTPPTNKSTIASASSRAYRRRLRIQLVAISSSAPKNILAAAWR